MKWNLKISILLLFCFLSKVHAEDNFDPDYITNCPPCPDDINCNFVETNDDCKCEVGYEGENCEIWMRQQTEDNCPCPEDAECNYEEESSDCKCKTGYEGENCEIWICDEENKALIYKCNGGSNEPCIRLDRICDGNEDCQYGEDEKTTCQADNNTCIGPVKLCDGVKDCSDNEDEYDCCYPPSEDPEDPCPEESKFDTCTQECVPKCDGKNDTCVTYHGVYARADSPPEWMYCAKYSDADEQNCPTTLPPGIICLIVICIIILLFFVGCITYYVLKRKNGIYDPIKEEAKQQTISEHSTPIIKPKFQTESDHSSPTPSLRIEPTTSTLPPDFELPPMTYFNPIDVNENGDHHPHFSNHIQSTKTSNAGIIEQLFIDKKPSE